MITSQIDLQINIDADSKINPDVFKKWLESKLKEIPRNKGIQVDINKLFFYDIKLGR